MRQVSGLRYGENPHQPAAFYSDLSLAEHTKGGIATAQLHHGKEVRPLLALWELPVLCFSSLHNTCTLLPSATAAAVLLLAGVHFTARVDVDIS